MSASIRIASIGLPPHERQCVDAFVAQDRRYRITLDLKRADLIIVNGDDAAAMLSRVDASELQAVLQVGKGLRGSHWPLVERPLNVARLGEAIHRLMPVATAWGDSPRGSNASLPEPTAATASFEPTRSFELTRSFEPTRPFEATQTFEATRSAERAPVFAATEPFAPLRREASDGDRAPAPDFAATKPFSPSELGGITSPTRVTERHAPIDESSVLLWRDAQRKVSGDMPPAEPLVAVPVGPGRLRGDAVPLAPVSTSDGSTEDVVEAALPSTPSVTAAAASPGGDSVSSEFPSSTSSRGRVLLIGHTRLLQSALMRALGRLGFVVDHATGTLAALARIQVESYDFVLFDDESLGIDTLASCRALHRHNRRHPGKRAPRMVVLAKSRPRLRRAFAWLAGCDAWMVLPEEAPALRKYLRKSGSRR
jgi:CheY-like chemotaxis protein